MANNDLEGDEHPFHVPWNGAGLLDDLHLSNETAVWRVHFDEVGFANAGLLDEFEPVGGGSVE